MHSLSLEGQNLELDKISKILNVIYFLASFSLNFPLGLDIHLGTEDNETICDSPPGSPIDIVDQVVNVILSHIIVTIIVFIFTVAIAVYLKKIRNNRRTLSQSVVIQSNKEYVITTMLFAVACLFVATRLPLIVIYETLPYLNNIYLETFTRIYLTSSVAILLLVINHSMNFVIYVIFFKEFRDKLVAMVTCKQNNSGANLRRSSTRFSMVTSTRVQTPAEIATIL